MKPLYKWLVGFLILFIVLTIISTFIRDFAGYSIIIGIALIVIGYLGGGITGEKYALSRAYMTTTEIDAHLKQRYHSQPLRIPLLALILGVILFCAGIVGYALSSMYFSPY